MCPSASSASCTAVTLTLELQPPPEVVRCRYFDARFLFEGATEEQRVTAFHARLTYEDGASVAGASVVAAAAGAPAGGAAGRAAALEVSLRLEGGLVLAKVRVRELSRKHANRRFVLTLVHPRAAVAASTHPFRVVSKPLVVSAHAAGTTSSALLRKRHAERFGDTAALLLLLPPSSSAAKRVCAGTGVRDAIARLQVRCRELEARSAQRRRTMAEQRERIRSLRAELDAADRDYGADGDDIAAEMMGTSTLLYSPLSALGDKLAWLESLGGGAPSSAADYGTGTGTGGSVFDDAVPLAVFDHYDALGPPAPSPLPTSADDGEREADDEVSSITQFVRRAEAVAESAELRELVYRYDSPLAPAPWLLHTAYSNDA